MPPPHCLTDCLSSPGRWHLVSYPAWGQCLNRRNATIFWPLYSAIQIYVFIPPERFPVWSPFFSLIWLDLRRLSLDWTWSEIWLDSEGDWPQKLDIKVIKGTVTPRRPSDQQLIPKTSTAWIPQIFTLHPHSIVVCKDLLNCIR